MIVPQSESRLEKQLQISLTFLAITTNPSAIPWVAQICSAVASTSISGELFWLTMNSATCGEICLAQLLRFFGAQLSTNPACSSVIASLSARIRAHYQRKMSIAQTTRLEALISARKGHDKALALIEEALLIGALSIAEAQHERNRAAEEWRRAKFINQNPESLAFEGLDVQDLSPPPVSSAATNAISVGDGQSGDDTLRLVPYKRPGSPTLKGTSGREKRQSMFATGNAKVGSPSRTGGKGVGKVGRRLALLGAGGKENVMCIKQDEQHRQLGGEDFIPILVPPATI